MTYPSRDCLEHCDHHLEVRIQDCKLSACKDHNIYLREEGRYEEYNEKKYVGFQVQDGMGCKKCGVKYKVKDNDGTYLLGKKTPIVMCNSMHLKKKCGDTSCDHSFCKKCWVGLAEEYAKEHNLAGGVGGRTRRNRVKEICA